MLEALRLALWLSKSFCANSYPELDEMIIKAYENAKQKVSIFIFSTQNNQKQQLFFS